ncbi:ROK family protein [Mesorhizobium retamae]|uniref:ROK family protein n=1 Tax=Mesorhizobium retamae TaxID=2912854 RepID=A0ABS9QFD8_9HYPH|nr:ROK family protein [Mesorhizobium sp. IRAMC:0171]MCG7505349.1 ROK family protein [Mesorhizobium sp. IRAMC:0171]
MNARGSHAIGIDIGGTKTKACLVRIADGAVLFDKTVVTPCCEGGQAVLDLAVALEAEVRSHAASVHEAECPLGVCLPELVTNRGEPGTAFNFEWRNLSYKAALSKVVPVLIESDVRSAAFAEGWIGAGRDAQTFVYVTLSTGVAFTLVVNGRPYRGERGYAIHFGNSELVTFTDAPEPVEVRHNLELLASGKALGRRYGALTGDPTTTGKHLFLAAATDPRAKQLLETSLLSIASYLGQMINMLDPGKVVIGGGMGGNPAINARLAELTRPFILAEDVRDIPILPAVLGDDVCAIGVAAMGAGAEAKGGSALWRAPTHDPELSVDARLD